MNTSNPPLIIESAKKQFNDWRAQRGKMVLFPDELWVNAVRLGFRVNRFGNSIIKISFRIKLNH